MSMHVQPRSIRSEVGENIVASGSIVVEISSIPLSWIPESRGPVPVGVQYELLLSLEMGLPGYLFDVLE